MRKLNRKGTSIMQTNVPAGDALAVKKWSAELARDINAKSYWDRRFVGNGENSVIQRKTELESDAGDRIQFDLSVQLRGRPTVGDERLRGKEEALKFFTDEIVIDQMRSGVSAGGRMSNKRTIHDLRMVARDRLGDYWAKYLDELHFIYLSGARGINEDFYEPVGWTGFANAIQAPDAAHIIYGGDAASKATIAAEDKMSVELIERACVKAQMMRATDPTTANMLPVNIMGEKHYVVVMSPFQAHDMRTGTTATQWLEIQKAAAAAEGRKSPIFRGGLGMVNNAVLHVHENVIRFSDYGTGTNLPASRALFLGRQAGACAYGTRGKGMRLDWFEEKEDRGNEIVITAGLIYGFKKTRFNGHDFGVLTIDTYAKDPN